MNSNDFVICTNENGLMTCEGFKINVPKQDDNTIYQNLVAPNWAFFRPPEFQQHYNQKQVFNDNVYDNDLYEQLLALATIKQDHMIHNYTPKKRKHIDHVSKKNTSKKNKKESKHTKK